MALWTLNWPINWVGNSVREPSDTPQEKQQYYIEAILPTAKIGARANYTPLVLSHASNGGALSVTGRLLLIRHGSAGDPEC